MDFSKGGASIKTKGLLPSGAIAFIGIPQFQMPGAAQVKHCVQSGGSYIIGLAFCGPMMR